MPCEEKKSHNFYVTPDQLHSKTQIKVLTSRDEQEKDFSKGFMSQRGFALKDPSNQDPPSSGSPQWEGPRISQGRTGAGALNITPLIVCGVLLGPQSPLMFQKPFAMAGDLTHLFSLATIGLVRGLQLLADPIVRFGCEPWLGGAWDIQVWDIAFSCRP